MNFLLTKQNKYDIIIYSRSKKQLSASIWQLFFLPVILFNRTPLFFLGGLISMIATINHNQLSITNNTQLVQGTVGAKIGVHFSKDWANLSKTAVFSAGDLMRDVVVHSEEITIPWELLANGGHELSLSFHGALANGAIVLRTNIAQLGKIRPSYAPSGQAPEAPSPARADQIQAIAELAAEDVQRLWDSASAGLFDGKDGISPTISVQSIAGGHRVSVTDAAGAKQFSVMDGAKGEKGDRGEKGEKGDTGPQGPRGESGEVTLEDLRAIEQEVADLKAFSPMLVKKAGLAGIWKEAVIPGEYSGRFRPVRLYTNGTHWKTDFNKYDWKVSNSSQKTYYVSITGSYLNDGLSRSNPITLYNAIMRASEGDTIVIEEGDYRNDTVTNAAIPVITKSINIIGEGKVRISKSAVKTPSYDSDTGLYTIVQPAVQGAYDPISDVFFTVVDSLADCKRTPDSIYYGLAPTVYLNLSYQHDIIAVFNDVMFVVDATEADVQLYMENIELMGGGVCFQTKTSAEHSCLVVCDSCTFSYNVGESGNVCSIKSAKSIMHNCVARFSRNDGFSYSVLENGAESGFVEIGCGAYSNGFSLSSDSSNGSSAHSGICGMRINGNYYDNKGANVADVQADTQTINCGCAAFNSRASQDGYNEGFACQQAGAKQWLYNCVAFGNFYDYFGVPGTEQISEKSSHKTSNYSFEYSGTLTDVTPKDLAVINFENNLMLVRQAIS